MEKIQRRLLMLRPTDNFPGCKNGTALRLQTEKIGVSASLSTACLKDDAYDIYLLLYSGDFSLVGQVKGGTLCTEVPNITLEDVAGAAIVHTENGLPVFCLVSTGMDWQDAAVRFKIVHMPNNDHNAASLPELPAPPAESPFSEGFEKEPIHPMPSLANETPERTAPSEPPSQNEKRLCDACPQTARQRRIDPFPSVFPGGEWIKVSYPGPTGWWHYITGTVDCTAAQGTSENGRTARVIGVPGDYGMSPPVWLEGFSTYLYSAADDARGYWLLFQDAQTGDVLNMDLSQHGG